MQEFESVAQLVAHYKSVHARLYPQPSRRRLQAAAKAALVVAPPVPLPSERWRRDRLATIPPADIAEMIRRVGMVRTIIDLVARHYDRTVADLIGPSRRQVDVQPRFVAIYLAKQLTQLSLPQISRRFGGRDHSTILHALNVIEARLQADEALRQTVRDLLAQMRSGAE